MNMQSQSIANKTADNKLSGGKATIFALSSGKGKAGVAVIRISGVGAKFALHQLGFTNIPAPRQTFLKKLKNIQTNEILDEALVIYFAAPNSFTGDDVVELHTHGSIAVVTSVLEYLGSLPNFRLAEAGEFSKTAFENGRLDLTQAEGLADLIDSETKAQARQALRLVEGEVGKKYEQWRTQMLEINAFIEAFIDFPEEDIPADLDLAFQENAENLIAELEHHLQNKIGERIRNGIISTIIGAPNVGKSSLMNLLSGRDMAIVSNIAGTTRDVLECNLDIGGYPVTLIDTAGIRESADEIEAEGVKRALEKAQKADLKIVMLNAPEYNNFNPEIVKLIEQNTIVIVNKIDENPVIDEIEFCGTAAIKISIKNKTGIDELKQKLLQKIADIFQNDLNENSETMPITRARHREMLNEAKTHLHNFIDARQSKLPIELCAEEVRHAANAIGKITGKIGVEDLLDKIFSSFCIGK
jgi:tRNA modification GTPase